MMRRYAGNLGADIRQLKASADKPMQQTICRMDRVSESSDATISSSSKLWGRPYLSSDDQSSIIDVADSQFDIVYMRTCHPYCMFSGCTAGL